MTPTELHRATGISMPYACQILHKEPDKRRVPSRSLAIHIFRKTGWRHESIAELTDEEIDFLERIDPYKSEAA